MIKHIRTMALSAMMTGLVALSADAVELRLDTVTCINHSTGQAVAGQTQGGQIDCAGLDTERGDSVGIVLLGTAEGGNGGGGGGGECDEIEEQEPNDRQIQDLGTLRSQECIEVVDASITAAFDSNNPERSDLDFYGVRLSGVSNIRLELKPQGGVRFGYVPFDANPGDILAECRSTTCEFSARVSALGVLVVAERPADYSLVIADAAGGVRRSLRVSSAATPMLDPLALEGLQHLLAGR